MVKARLTCPWQLVRLAIKAAESDAASRIAATPYAVAVNIVVDEVEGMVRDLRAGLKRGAGEAVNTLLKSIHDAARGLRSELDLAIESPWGAATCRDPQRDFHRPQGGDRSRCPAGSGVCSGRGRPVRC